MSKQVAPRRAFKPMRRPQTPPMVSIVVHNYRWPDIYEAEKQAVMAAIEQAGFRQRIVAAEHVGSTSVPGLGAKPVVDFMIGVREANDLTAFPRLALTRIGYVARPFLGMRNREHRLLFSRYAAPATNLHVFVHGGLHWGALLGVRDYLRGHPKAAAMYEHVKRAFASHSGQTQFSYAQGKRPFLDSLQAAALLAGQIDSAVTPTRAPRARTDAENGGYPDSPTTDFPDPSGWDVGVWYVQDPGHWPWDTSAWRVSPVQNPYQPFGRYLGWTGDYWHIVENGAPPPTDGFPQATRSDPTTTQCTAVITREDGTTYTVILLPEGDINVPIPEGSKVVFNTDGTTLVLYNNDGTPWNDGQSGGPGSDTPGGDTPGGDTPGGNATGGGGGEEDDWSPYMGP
jgi:GrpB-like predicted nucleotidyltransferase (UPF0157 family)